MSYNALGLLETYGYIPAVVAIDAALKAANVTLKDFQAIGGGLVTMMVEGDVAAVKSSIEAGSTAAKTIGHVISEHVIPRPDIQLKLLFQDYDNKSQHPIEEEPEPNSIEEEQEAEQETKVDLEELKLNTLAKENSDIVIYHNGKQIKINSKKDLYRMKVVELRKIVRGFKDFSIEANKIKFANKSELVNAILDYFKMEVE